MAATQLFTLLANELMLPIPPFIGVIRLNLFSSCLIMASGRPNLRSSTRIISVLIASTIASANVDSLIFESVLRGDALLISLHAVGGGGGAVVGLDSGTGSMSPNVTDFGFAYLPLEGQVLHRMRRLRSVDSVGSRIRMQVTNSSILSCPELPLKFSYRGPFSYEVLETRICSIRGWKTGRVGVARSTVDMHRVRVRNELRWERPSPGVPTVRPLSVHAYRRDKAIRRRDRTRQPVTTPQLVTPLER
ncbi:hypothetical protein EVAR_11565_1 [Eumeta japonica]|uniref:Uncharacterized protein n=1 Tax=Eumeta variegata TaxID=151549 RepID=A0A4C1X7P2_EUMVA|nr:hypothetical protein EVAR_11565_1 [Eumeta japonica]